MDEEASRRAGEEVLDVARAALERHGFQPHELAIVYQGHMGSDTTDLRLGMHVYGALEVVLALLLDGLRQILPELAGNMLLASYPQDEADWPSWMIAPGQQEVSE